MSMIGRIATNLFPRGTNKALTFSYDDGTTHDRLLVEILDKNGLKGTFHLNSSLLGKEGFLREEEICSLFRNHEIACHSSTHPFLNHIPPSAALEEIKQDRLKLEKMTGQIIRGFSYPYAAYDSALLGILPATGIAYARTVEKTHQFGLPDNFLRWHPTCHHDDPEMDRLISEFIGNPFSGNMLLFYIWGHSHEFNRKGNWNRMEDLCGTLGRAKDVWFATNIEIHDYLASLRRLEWSADCSLVRNPSALEVWISFDNHPLRIRAGETLNLNETKF
jgi:hypothetical protein